MEQWSHELHRAAAGGEAERLGKLLEAGVSTELRGGVGAWLRGAYHSPHRTALHHAAKGGHLGCVRLLLSYGANPNAMDGDGYTPLHYVCQIHDPQGQERAECVEGCATSLLQFGAHGNAVTSTGRSATELARTQRNTVCQRILHHHGTTCTPLLYAPLYYMHPLLYAHTQAVR